MKKWYNYYTENPRVKEMLRRYLKSIGVNPYISECYDGWDFQIELNEEEFESAEWFLSVINEYVV